MGIASAAPFALTVIIIDDPGPDAADWIKALAFRLDGLAGGQA